jgi:hypothetical protein
MSTRITQSSRSVLPQTRVCEPRIHHAHIHTLVVLPILCSIASNEMCSPIGRQVAVKVATLNSHQLEMLINECRT